YLYKALNNPELFKQIDSTLKLIKNSIPQQQPNKEVLIHEQENIEKLRNYMKEQQSFLNPSLTIQNVSDEIEIPVKELSLLINHKLNQHFYDFVNSYRINYAKNLLSDSTQNKRTVLEILYDSGFNSKSSFNTAFKKETGTTPTSYRKNLIINT
ncbi:AraC family transcriptional regulator, partial [Aquimarina sp. AD1]